MTVRILQGDCREVLATLDAGSVHCCVTSPPYFGLRDYGHEGQIGLEQTPAEYVEQMVAVFREVRRVLRDDGTLWLNLGDSYANDTKWGGSTSGKHVQAQHGDTGIGRRRQNTGLKSKDLIGIPWRVAFALQADGWVLRQEIIWAKPNPMPESVRDRCTKSHEQVFLFAKARWSGPQPGRFAHISDADARWLALLIDAEGCIVVKRCKHEGRGDTFSPQVSIGNTSEALMREVVRITGHGSLLERPGKNCRMLYWQVANGIARDLLERIYTFLIVKQRQARIGIHVDSLTYFRGGKLPERKQRSDDELNALVSLWARNKECNSFGHPELSDVPEPVFGRWADCERYHYNAEAIAEPSTGQIAGNVNQTKGSDDPKMRMRTGLHGYAERQRSKRDSFKRDNSKRAEVIPGQSVGTHRPDREESAYDLGTRNRRSVWTIATKPFKEAHFATMAPELAETCIKAGCPEGGTVLDPFGGAGTTGLVADRLRRDAVLVELNPAYIDIARRRIAGDAPLFAEVA